VDGNRAAQGMEDARVNNGGWARVDVSVGVCARLGGFGAKVGGWRSGGMQSWWNVWCVGVGESRVVRFGEKASRSLTRRARRAEEAATDNQPGCLCASARGGPREVSAPQP
jgi:hypothetical protein